MTLPVYVLNVWLVYVVSSWISAWVIGLQIIYLMCEMAN